MVSAEALHRTRAFNSGESTQHSGSGEYSLMYG